MNAEQSLYVVDLLPEPCFLVSARGEVLAANRAATAFLRRPATQLVGATLAQLAEDAPERLNELLSASSRTRSMRLGALTLRPQGGDPVRCRCEGALLAPASDLSPAQLLLRLSPARAGARGFALLDRQLAELRRTHRALLERTTELERARARIERLQAATAALSSALTPEEVAAVVIEHCTAALQPMAISVSSISADGRALELVRFSGYSEEAVAPWRRIPLDSHVALTEAVRTGEAVLLESEREWRDRYGKAATLHRVVDGSRSWAAIPLVVSGRPVGAVGMSFTRKGPFLADERAFMLSLAEQCGQALERARLYAEAEQARQRADDANRVKAEFLATMSHELRTPLNAIAGHVELLELGLHGSLTDAQREALQRVRRNQRHLLSLVNDVLNFARIESGHVHYELADWPLDAVLREAGSMMAPQLEASGVVCEHRPCPPELRVRVDREKLRQIVLNLLSNAGKFTERGGRVEIAVEPGSERVIVRVHDTGCGIPPDQLEAIFEPFVQVDRGLTRTHEGAGLGLAISRDLARAMGGELTVESTVGTGSTFSLELPRSALRGGTYAGGLGSAAREAAPRG